VGVLVPATYSVSAQSGADLALTPFSPVHVNRVLQQMRAEGLIETKGTRLRIPDWDKLKEVGEFDPTYLHLVREDVAA
jgi:hypothetical protein